MEPITANGTPTNTNKLTETRQPTIRADEINILRTQSSAVSIVHNSRTPSYPVAQDFGGDQESFSDAARLKTNEPLAAVRVSLTK